MSALTLTREFGEMRVRSQRTLAISAVAHALFFAWLLVSRQLVPPADPIVEITWLETLPAVRVELPQPAPEKLEVQQIRPTTEAPLSVREKLARSGKTADDVRRRLQALAPVPAAERALLAQPAPAIGRVAQAKLANGGIGETTPAQIVQRRTAARLRQLVLEPGAGRFHNLLQSFTFRGAFAFLR